MKLTAPQLRVLRLMRDGWTLYAGQGTGWMARLRKDGEQSQGLAYNTLYALLDRKLCRRVTKLGSNRDRIYRLTALGRDAAGEGT